MGPTARIGAHLLNGFFAVLLVFWIGTFLSWPTPNPLLWRGYRSEDHVLSVVSIALLLGATAWTLRKRKLFMVETFSVFLIVVGMGNLYAELLNAPLYGSWFWNVAGWDVFYPLLGFALLLILRRFQWQTKIKRYIGDLALLYAAWAIAGHPVDFYTVHGVTFETQWHNNPFVNGWEIAIWALNSLLFYLLVVRRLK